MVIDYLLITKEHERAFAILTKWDKSLADSFIGALKEAEDERLSNNGDYHYA